MAEGKLIRISTRQYENIVADVLGARLDLGQHLDPDPVLATGFRVGFDIAPSAVPRYMDAAAAVAALLVDRTGPSAAQCLKGAPTPACADAVGEALVTRLWRRKLSPADRAGLQDVLAKGVTAGEAAYGFWVYVLMHPHFLFVVEEPSADGMLTDFELAARLSLALWQSAPDPELVAAANAGALRKTDALAAQAARMTTLPRARETVEQFLTDWATLKALSSSTLDPKRFPGWSQQAAQSYQRSVLELFRDAAAGDMMRTLLNESSYWSDDAMLRLLGTRPRAPDGRADFGEGRRGGLLTHPAFLAANSSSGGGDIIHRGVFVRRSVLCEPGASVPEGLDTSLPDAGNPVTNRDRFEPILKRQPCGGCHSLFQPLGNAFENFDAAGAWRTVDNGVPVNATGSVRLALTDRDLAFNGAADLAGQVYASAQASACLARHWLRYALWAPVSQKTSASLRAAHEAFVAGGHRLEALVRGTVMTDAFRRYTPPEK